LLYASGLARARGRYFAVYEPPNEPPPEVEQDDPPSGQTKIDERIAQEEPDRA
jgi:hypothetical protein